MLTKTSGLILKVNKLGDNDCLYTILTEDMKKVTALSRGIRSLKHKDFAALQLFCYSELELSNKGNLYYISNANVKNNFYNIRLSVEKLSLATYVNEICANVSEFLEGDNEYFRFVLNTLYFIEHAEGETETNELKKLKAIFELRSASFAGFMPSFLKCVNCGCEKNLAFFDVMGGGAVCADCKSQNAIGVNEYLLKTMQFLCCAPLKTVFSTPIKNEDALDVINTISERYISEKLEYYFKSLDYYNNIMKKTMWNMHKKQGIFHFMMWIFNKNHKK